MSKQQAKPLTQTYTTVQGLVKGRKVSDAAGRDPRRPRVRAHDLQRRAPTAGAGGLEVFLDPCAGPGGETPPSRRVARHVDDKQLV
jgi:hypothetical protein